MEPLGVTLRPNWSLLDSAFESYKLSLQQLPIYSVNLKSKPDIIILAEEDFSYNRTKAISMHNCLFGDPWNDCISYFVDDSGQVTRISFTIKTSEAALYVVCSLDPCSLQCDHNVPITLSFPSAVLCLISDGAGFVHLFRTGDRSDLSIEKKWQVLLSQKLMDNAESLSTILHTRIGNSGTRDEVVDILTMRFEDEKIGDSVSTVAVIDHISIANHQGEMKCGVETCHTLKGKQAPFFAAFGENEIFFGSHSPLKLEPDWNQQALDKQAIWDLATIKQKPSSYTWSQTDEDITILVLGLDGVNMDSVEYVLSKDRIKVGFKNSDDSMTRILDGELFDAADCDSSNWSIVDNALEINIRKRVSQTWPCVVTGDTNGHAMIGTHPKNETTEAGGFQPAGLDRYEDCDDLPDADSMLYRFDVSSCEFTHEASIASNQWLFNCYFGDKLCTVLRHDIDALVWGCSTPNELSPNPWTHIATFNALGYVRASKEDVKYSGCSSTASYAALCESSRRIFVYHSPTSTAAPLRNRVTGKQMHMSKQQVVTLPSNCPILGFCVTNKLMFILMESKVFVVKVNAPET